MIVFKLFDCEAIHAIFNLPQTKVYLENLAKISGVKRQSYQENLRRAEEKLIPFLTENIQE